MLYNITIRIINKIIYYNIRNFLRARPPARDTYTPAVAEESLSGHREITLMLLS